MTAMLDEHKEATDALAHRSDGMNKCYRTLVKEGNSGPTSAASSNPLVPK
jgi:hypothetical protein